MINYPLASDSWDEKEFIAIQEVIDSRMFSMGLQVAAYERQFADFFGSKHAVMVSSGSAANLLMIAALFYTKIPKLQPGDEVIVPAVSWSTTYFPLQQYGLKVVFVDVDQNTLNIDIAKLELAVTDKTRAILLVNLLGNPNEFDAIQRIAKQRNVLLLEDNCESMGATYKGRQAGTFGIMGTYSSFYSHHIATMEGGCVVTDNEEIYHVLLSLRAHGWTRNLPKHNLVTGTKSEDPFEESFKFVLPGYNVRPLEMSGAIGQQQLKKLPTFIENRRSNAEIYRDLFGQHPYLSIQQEIGRSSWFGFSFIIKDDDLSRKELVAKLTEHGVEVRPIVAGNFVKNDVTRFFDYRIAGDLTGADIVDTRGFFVGNHQDPIGPQLKALRELLD